MACRAGDSGSPPGSSRPSNGSVEFKIQELKSSDYLDITQESQIFGSDKSNVPPAQYSRVSEVIRQITSSNPTVHRIQCGAFCGGKHCKHEDPSRWTQSIDNPFNGLYSTWITENILAMARPSTLLFTEYRLLEKFKEAGIKAVINLQTPGEHAHCGPASELHPSGFTYNPEDFMKSGIYYYNYSWPDYCAPSEENILDVVKVIDFSCIEGKIALHCHAGLGRTGVAIACYLVYSLRVPPEEAIRRVRDKRPGSIQTRVQIDLVHNFSIQLCSLWTLYPSSHLTSFTIDEYVERQSKLFHGEERNKYKHIPKIIDVICEQLNELGQDKLFQYHTYNTSESTSLALEKPPNRIDKKESWLVILTQEEEEEESTDGGRDHQCLSDDDHLIQSLCGTCPCSNSENFKRRITNLEVEFNNRWIWESLTFETDPTVLFNLLFTYLSRLKEPLLSEIDYWQENFTEHISKVTILS
jgi:protein tyrosine phosphatase domain-containing protein 1